MAVRAWRLWGISTVLAAGAVALAQPAGSGVSGRATPALTQDHYQPESAPPPRLLPQQVLDFKPSGTAPPTAILDPLVGLAAAENDVGGPRWKSRVALDVAEMHFRACDTAEARNWYREVIKLAPESEYARRAAERLRDMDVLPAAGQSEEPPLCDAGRIQVRFPIP
jgi:hypothetical protein